MERYAAFLRGINLGKRRVTGERLCALFVDLGFGDVDSFLASGNVIFTADDHRGLADTIEGGLEAGLGYPVLTFLRTEAELGAIVARAPFSSTELAASSGKVQVMLLREPPSDDAATALHDHASNEDRLVLHGRELYWLPVGNMSASALDLGAIERLVGPTTIRTGNTLARLHARYFTDANGT